MALRHHSTQLCDYLIQAVDGKFTQAGIFSNVFAVELPLSRPIGVLVEFAGDPGDLFRVSVEGPAGSELNLILADGVLESPTLRHPMEQWTAKIGGVASLQFTTEGIYRVILRSGDAVIHEYPFAVLLYQPATPPADQPASE